MGQTANFLYKQELLKEKTVRQRTTSHGKMSQGHEHAQRRTVKRLNGVIITDASVVETSVGTANTPWGSPIILSEYRQG